MKTKRFPELVEKSRGIGMSNAENKGLIPTVPFHYTKRFGLGFSCRKYRELAAKIADFFHNIAVDLKSFHTRDATKEGAFFLKTPNRLQVLVYF